MIKRRLLMGFLFQLVATLRAFLSVGFLRVERPTVIYNGVGVVKRFLATEKR
jgi:hypothetical protein